MTKNEAIKTALSNSARRQNGWYDVFQVIDTDRFIVSEDAESYERVGGYDRIDLKFIGRYVNGKRQ
jgi:hypothetical protein